MIKTERKNKSVICFFVIILIIYIFMFFGNYFTPKVVDDFGYCYSWATGERVKNIADIVESMKVHRIYANGRIIPHGIVQFFLMFPDIVFDVINPLFFIAELLLIFYYAFDFKINPYDNKALIVFCVFGLIWLAQPAFGQVNFWLDGSCNYLLAAVIHLLFFLPFYKLYKNTESLKSIYLKILFILFGFIAGAFSENGSAAVMAMAGIIILAQWIKKEKVPFVYYLSLAASFFGYISMVFVPATSGQGRFASVRFPGGLLHCLFILGKCLPVVAVYVIAVMFLLIKKKTAEIKTSLIFVFGSFVSLLLLAFVSFQSDRRGYFSVILMVIADLILFKELFDIPDFHKNCLKVLFGFAVFSIIIMGIGMSDIHNTYNLIKQNEQHIIYCRSNSQYDVEISDIKPKTKYSAIDELVYINTSSSNTWPNDSMAKYYGVKSISGKNIDLNN